MERERGAFIMFLRAPQVPCSLEVRDIYAAAQFASWPYFLKCLLPSLLLCFLFFQEQGPSSFQSRASTPGSPVAS